MFSHARKFLLDVLNGGIGPGDPRWDDRALVRRIQILNC